MGTGTPIRLADLRRAPRHGSHHIPNINFYVGSDNNTTFDSRGFSYELHLPALDGIGNILNDRTDRGTPVEFSVLLRDNQGSRWPIKASWFP